MPRSPHVSTRAPTSTARYRTNSRPCPTRPRPSTPHAVAVEDAVAVEPPNESLRWSHFEDAVGGSGGPPSLSPPRTCGRGRRGGRGRARLGGRGRGAKHRVRPTRPRHPRRTRSPWSSPWCRSPWSAVDAVDVERNIGCARLGRAIHGARSGRKRASSGQVSEPRSTARSPHAATGLRATWMRVRV